LARELRSGAMKRFNKEEEEEEEEEVEEEAGGISGY
jgi:hypothetical protein